eukprot:gene38838-47234_t
MMRQKGLALLLFIVIASFHAVSEAFRLVWHRRKTEKARLCKQLKLKDAIQQSDVAELVGNALSSTYTPPEVGPEIWVGSFVSLIPIVWATIEFTGRIRTQQKCLVCNGSGLVYTSKSGIKLNRPRKCWNCGGFLPWLGWKMFFLSTFTDIGNGGVLQRPARDYDETNEKIRNGDESVD